MYQQLFDLPNEFGNKAFKVVQELAAINGKVVNSLIEKQISLVNACVENGAKELKTLEGVSSVNDAYAVNVELAQKNAAVVSATISETYEILQDAAKNYSELLADSIKQVKAVDIKAA